MIRCINHGERQANNLCMSCSNWFCNSCICLSKNPPICMRCNSAETEDKDFFANRIEGINFLKKLLNIPIKTKSSRKKLMVGKITTAQIEALLRDGNKLTASRLASATNVSEEYASKVLKDMAIEGDLIASTDDSTELIYSKIFTKTKP